MQQDTETLWDLKMSFQVNASECWSSTSGFSGWGWERSCRHFKPVSFLLDVEQLAQAIKVDDVSGSNGAFHNQVVQHCDNVDHHISRGPLVTSTPRELLNQVTHHLCCCQSKTKLVSDAGHQGQDYKYKESHPEPQCELSNSNICLARKPPPSGFLSEPAGVSSATFSHCSGTHTSRPCCGHSGTGCGLVRSMNEVGGGQLCGLCPAQGSRSSLAPKPLC